MSFTHTDAAATSARDRLAKVWSDFAANQCRGYSPLYEAISNAVAADPEVLDLVLEAPRPGWQPNVLLAAAHYLLLAGTGADHALADVYTGTATAAAEDPGALFCEFVLAHREAIADLLATRRTNTNECGRSAVLVPALAWAAARIGEPLVLLDVGTSAGINLNLDRYSIDYGPHGWAGPADAAVRIECEVEGAPPLPPPGAAPTIAARAGLDRAPVDLTDDDQARWLLACVWPDTGRMARTAASIDITRAHPPRVLAGDMVSDLHRAIAELPDDAPLCVTTTWVLAYLPRAERPRFVDQLRAAAGRRPVAWISAEGRDVVDGLPPAPAGPADGIEPSVLAAHVFQGGQEEVHLLGLCHPHGSWLRWLTQG